MPRQVPDYSDMNVANMGKAMEKVNLTAGQQLKETMSLALEAMKKGAMPKDVLGIKPETIEYFYAQAYRMYNQGKYKEALYLFQMLVVMDATRPRHILGSAACLHRMGKYEAAAKLYTMASPLDPANPLPYFHAADCFIKLGVHILAEYNLKKCLEACGENPQFALIKDRATLMLQASQEALAREEKEAEAEGQGEAGANPEESQEKNS